MKRMTAEQIAALYKQCKSDQNVHEVEWEEHARYVQPSKVGFFEQRYPGEQKTEWLWDSTAIHARINASHYLSSVITPATGYWLGIKFRDKELADSDKPNEWLEESIKITRAEISRSNFYAQAGEFYDDILTFGTSPFQIEERRLPGLGGLFVGPHYEAAWLRDVVCLANPWGELDTTIRCYERTALQWYSQFGDEIGEQVSRLARTEPKTKVKVYHASYPRDPDEIDRDALAGGHAASSRQPYASVWVNEKDVKIFREGGSYAPSRVVPRWSTSTGTNYGSSPTHTAMPDIKTLNEAKRLGLIAWEKGIDPTLLVNESMQLTNLNRAAGSVNVVRDIDGIRKLDDLTDTDKSMIEVMELRSSIKEIFFSDLINEPAEVKSGTTAYEVAKRMERAQRILGEAVGRIREEFVRPVVEQTFHMLLRNNKFPPIPEELDSADLDVVYNTPLQTAQELQGIENIQMFLVEGQNLAAIQSPEDPGSAEVLDLIDFDEILSEQAKRRGIPATVLRSEDEINDVRDARRQQQTEDRELELAMQNAAVAKDMSQAGAEAVGVG